MDLHFLGRLLQRIARGEDARLVFKQGGKRGRQSEGPFNSTRALVYWQHRAKYPADVKGAVRKAQEHFSYLPKPSRATIERYARRWRDTILERLPVKAWQHREDGSVETIPSGIDTTALLAHVARKSKRGKPA